MFYICVFRLLYLFFYLNILAWPPLLRTFRSFALRTLYCAQFWPARARATARAPCAHYVGITKRSQFVHSKCHSAKTNTVTYLFYGVKLMVSRFANTYPSLNKNLCPDFEIFQNCGNILSSRCSRSIRSCIALSLFSFNRSTLLSKYCVWMKTWDAKM